MGFWDVVKAVGQAGVDSAADKVQRREEHYQRHLYDSDEQLKKLYRNTSDTDKKIAIGRILKERGY